jgi:flagellar hook-length control protein FliK
MGMKIQSITPETDLQPSENVTLPDASIDIPTDFLLDLLAQFSTDSKNEPKNLSLSSDQNNDEDSTAALTQQLLINNVLQTIPELASLIEDVTSPTSTATDFTLNSMNENAIIRTPNTEQTGTKLVLEKSGILMQKDSVAESEKGVQLEDLISSGKEASLSSVPNTHTAPKPEFDAMAPVVSAMLKESQINPAALPSLASNSILTAKILSSEYENKVSEHAKPMQFFSQLSYMLNVLTSRNHEDPLLNLVSEKPLASYEDIKNAQDLGYESRLELLSASVGPQRKESYDAKIKIYPPELGSVIAKLKMENNKVELMLLTETNHVKQVIEANLPLLKEHFIHSDMQLTDIQVQTNLPDNQQNADDKLENRHFQDKGQPKSLNPATSLPEKESKLSNSLVDTYA